MRNIIFIAATAFQLLILSPVRAEVSAAPAELYNVTASDAEAAISQALIDKGIGEHVKAILITQKSTSLYASDKPVEIQVTGLQADKASGRFTANLLFASNGEVLSAQPASGRYQEMLQLPVLKRIFKAGDIITKEDIDYADFPLTRSRADVVDDANKIIGQSPRRLISANRPIRAAELAAPTVVKKNAMVQIVYKGSGMELATSGQALDAGGVGDVISVRNVSSKQIIRASIQDDKTVSVTPFVQTTSLGVK